MHYVENTQAARLINTTLWAIEKMFQDEYDAYPSTLYARLCETFGRDAVEAVKRNRDHARG